MNNSIDITTEPENTPVTEFEVEHIENCVFVVFRLEGGSRFIEINLRSIEAVEEMIDGLQRGRKAFKK